MKRTWLFILIVLVFAAVGWTGAFAAPPTQGEQADITSPQNNAVVRGLVPIQGNAIHPQFQFYKVEFAREPVVGEAYTIVGAIHQQQVTGGQLETWDTSQLPDGSYTLRLRVVRLDGNYSEYSVVQVVVANAQPTETPTPAIVATKPPTVTPTPLPPTPTIVIEQPVVTNTLSVTGTAAAATRAPLPTPISDEGGGFNLDVAPLQTACLYGAGVGLGIFLLFGFMAALRNLIYALISRR